MSLIWSVFVLAALIFVHELGHFLFAKFCGVTVLEFSIGFGKQLFRKHFRGTYYSIRMVPLGGYVKMAGDDPRLVSSDEGSAASDLENYQDIEESLVRDKSRWFLNQNIPKKFAIVFAGPLFNLLFALALSSLSFIIFGKSEPIDKPIIGGVIKEYPASLAGLMEKDVVRKVNGVEVVTWEQLAKAIESSHGDPVKLEVERINENQESSILNLEIKPTFDSEEMAIVFDNDEKEQKRYKIGIMPASKLVKATILESALYSTVHIYYICKITFKGIWAMLTNRISSKNIAGPIFIFSQASETAEKGAMSLMGFMVFLSVSLALLNLLPIPILDGGHLLFFIIEAIKGTPVNIRVQEVSMQVGMVLLMLLMVFAISNDVIRLFGQT